MSRGLKTAPGEQPVATEIRPAQIEQPGNLGVAQGFASMAADFGEVAGKVSQLADQAASVAGQKAGEQRGLDPEFRPTHSLSIYGKAFDEAGLNVYKTEANSKMLADLNGVYEQHQGDPAGFQAAADAKRAAWLDGSLQDVRPELAVSFDKQMLTLHREAVRTQHDRMDAQNRAASETEITTRMRQIQQRAYGNGLDPAADQVLAGDVADLQGVLQRQGLNGAPLVAPEQAQKIVQNAKDEAMQSRILGTFDRLPGTDAKEAFLRQFQDDFANGKGAAAGMGVQNYEAMQGKLIKEMRQQHYLDREQTNYVVEKFKSATAALESGIAPPPDERAALRVEVAKITNPKIRAQFEIADRLYDWQDQARTMSPKDLSLWVNSEANRLHTEGGTPEEVHRLDMTTKLLGNMHKDISEDAIGWASRIGFTKPVPIDMSAPGKFAASLEARIPQAVSIGQHYNQPPQFFSKYERMAVAASIAQGGPDGLAFAGAIGAQGSERARSIMQEIAPDAPAMAALGIAVADNGTHSAVAQDAMAGLAARRDPEALKLYPVPKDEQTAPAFKAALNGALSANEDTERAYIDLANAVYQRRAGLRGKDDFGADIWKKGMTELLGEKTMPDGRTFGGVVDQGTWNRNTIVLPANLNKARWRDAIDMLTPDDLQQAGLGKPMGSDGKEVSMDRLKNGVLRLVGDGQYRIALSGGALTTGTERWVQSETPNKPYVLDFKKLAPILMRRRPDLFLGSQ